MRLLLLLLHQWMEERSPQRWSRSRVSSHSMCERGEEARLTTLGSAAAADATATDEVGTGEPSRVSAPALAEELAAVLASDICAVAADVALAAPDEVGVIAFWVQCHLGSWTGCWTHCYSIDRDAG